MLRSRDPDLDLLLRLLESRLRLCERDLERDRDLEREADRPRSGEVMLTRINERKGKDVGKNLKIQFLIS